jgi:hypothetical protein
VPRDCRAAPAAAAAAVLCLLVERSLRPCCNCFTRRRPF